MSSTQPTTPHPGVQTRWLDFLFLYLLKVCTNIYISHHCLFNEVSKSHSVLPSCCHWPGLAAQRPKAMSYASSSFSPTCSTEGWAWHTLQHCLLLMYLSQCQLQWRHALLKTGSCLQFVSISFQQVFTYVLHPSCPHPLRQSWTLCWLSQAFSWDENGDFFVYLAVIVLIRLDYRIFHKRSDGQEKFSFCLRIVMQRVRALKGDFCVSWPHWWTSFCLAAFFVLCF